MKKSCLLLRAMMVCLAVLALGCAAKLEIFETSTQGTCPSPEVKKGVPFRVPTPYVIEGCLTKLKTGGDCDALPFVRVESLPSKELYYASIDPGWFADSEFSMNLDERGNLKQLSVNSKPALSETLDSITNTIVELKKLKEAKRESINGEGVVGKLRPPSLPCDTGEVVRKISPLDKWKELSINEAFCDR